jgi:hypothetical protein
MTDPLPSWNDGQAKQALVTFVKETTTQGAPAINQPTLDALLASPFPAFTFSAEGVSAYQFGNFGTAAKLLHSFKLTQ